MYLSFICGLQKRTFILGIEFHLETFHRFHIFGVTSALAWDGSKNFLGEHQVNVIYKKIKSDCMLSITQVSDVDILELYQFSHRENW